ITCRTAGFATYDMSALSCLPVTYMITILLMLIGASPCSTGGGVKTTTFGVIALAIYYFARGKETKAYNRRINEAQISKAFVLMLVALMIVILGSAVVLAIQPELGIQSVLFEVVSAFSTTGLSMGITASLGVANRIIIVLIMFFGRLGPLTIIGVLNKNWMANTKEEISYAKENVIIG
nr:Ktr system potassium uptake protein D [Acholeplasmatales bacterium]